jgi:hypothetical protein
MPFGIISFNIAVDTPGDQAVVNLYFSEPAAADGGWYKYDPVADQRYDFSAYAEFASDRLSVALTLTDGAPGDANGVANGVISDPSGLGVSDAGGVNPDQSAGSGGSGGGEGCFIHAIADRQMDGAWLSHWGLAGILVLLSIACPKRTRGVVR